MKKLILLITMIVSINPLFAEGPSVNWMPDWDSAKLAAMKSGKNIFILFTAPDWCVYCVKLEEETLNDPRVIDYLNDNFICFKILDTDPDINNYNIAIKGFPTIVITAPDGNRICVKAGYCEPEALIDWTAPQAYNGGPQNSIENKDYLDDPNQYHRERRNKGREKKF